MSLRSAARLVLVVLALAATGCVESAIFEATVPMDYEPVPRPPPPGATAGAIWPGDRQAGSFLFFDEKARQPGDLVTVVIAENLSAQGEATTELDNGSTFNANLSSDIGFQDWTVDVARKVFESIGILDPGRSVATGTNLNVLSAGATNEFDGEGTTSRRAGFQGVITARVVNVLPGAVLHVRGRRMLHVNHELQVVTVEGLVRSEDISINNSVRSTDLAEARLTFDGVGVIDDRQRPGLVARVLAWLYPF